MSCHMYMQVLSEILSELQVGEFVIKLNHRRLLDAMMDMCGVPPSKFRPICRYSPALLPLIAPLGGHLAMDYSCSSASSETTAPEAFWPVVKHHELDDACSSIGCETVVSEAVYLAEAVPGTKLVEVLGLRL